MKKMEKKIADEEEEHEARRLKTMAERLYEESNLDHALEYAERALKLRPDLDGVSELVMAFTILQIAAAKSPTTGSSCGGGSSPSSPDWYKILQTEPFSHINVVKKQYRKLALLLHPDKNSFVASEEAFKLVGDAFRCLSDKVKRKEYDMQLRLAIQEAAAATAGGDDDGNAEAERFTASCSECGSSHRFERRYIGHNLMCPSCKKSFIALEVEASHNVVDRDDNNDDDVTIRDLASDLARKRTDSVVVECDDDVTLMDLAIAKSRARKHVDSRVLVVCDEDEANNEVVEDDDDDVALRDLASTSSRARKRVDSRVLVVCDEDEANNEVVEDDDDDVALRDLASTSSRARKRVDNEMMVVCDEDEANNEVVDCDDDDDDVTIRDLASAGGVMKGVKSDRLKKVESKRKTSSVSEVMERLEKNDLNGGGDDAAEGLSVKRGRTGDEMTLAEFQLKAKRKSVQAKTKVKLTGENETVKGSNQDNRKSPEIPQTRKRSASNRSRGSEVENQILNISQKSKNLVIEAQQSAASKKHDRKVQAEAPEPTRRRRAETRVSRKDDDSMEVEDTESLNGWDIETMTVVDSDFYDFDRDRVERSFKQGQVWALYDDDDGMPRHYGLIVAVPSFNPFELKMSWLDSQSNGDHGQLCQNISCGRFKVSKDAVIGSVNFFSHVVDCERVARAIYRIYPKKGSIWALYKEGITEGDGCYDIAVLLTSYSEMHGLSAAYLTKVDGYKTVFKRREIGPHAVRLFGKDDIWLFSHQIPAKKLSVADAPESMGDCWELDPASLPKDLLTIASNIISY